MSSEVHFHLHIPAGYRLVMADHRLVIEPLPVPLSAEGKAEVIAALDRVRQEAESAAVHRQAQLPPDAPSPGPRPSRKPRGGDRGRR